MKNWINIQLNQNTPTPESPEYKETASASTECESRLLITKHSQKNRGEAVLRNTCENGTLVNKSINWTWTLKGPRHYAYFEKKSTETQLYILHLYTSKKRYNISISWCLEWKDWFSNCNATVTTENHCGPKSPRFEPRTDPFFSSQKVRTCWSCERIEKRTRRLWWNTSMPICNDEWKLTV